MDCFVDPLTNLIADGCYQDILSARTKLLRQVKSKPGFLSGNYSKNKEISEGPDFGGEFRPHYLPAIRRYNGNLYSVDEFSARVEQTLQIEKKPHILIFSALYGPLHPLSPIQDYNLQMSDKPAYEIWGAAFALFLLEYVNRNSVQDIRLYLGRTTDYLRAARDAIGQLARRVEVIYYDVENGNSRETPRNHGKQFLADLGYPISDFSRRVIAR